MIIKDILDESFQDYKKPSMMIAMCNCDWKCLKECNLDISICQNSELSKQPNIEMPIDFIIGRYLNNPLTSAVVLGGLEPMLQFAEVLVFIDKFREICDDDIVIYTGYYPYEMEDLIDMLKRYKNIVIKFGRYMGDRPKIFDEVLGITLVSDNQYAVKIS